MSDYLAGKQVKSADTGISLLESCQLHEEDHVHTHDADPHFWLSPVHAMTMAQNICTALEERFPSHKETFQKNLAALQADLQALLAYGKETLSSLSCRELITFHDGFSYFAECFNLTILEAVEEESGSEASAKELRHLIGLVKEHQLPAIFTEANGSTASASIIIRETSISSFSLDMAMATSYFDAMYHNINTIKEALG
jgi:ABC-type Zn uptake system ZnuABC Zn-binding protein ZnuA